MFKTGDIVRYNSKWCTEKERHLIHLILEVRLNPCTMTETRYLIETLNGMKVLGRNLQEVVDDFMIEQTGLNIEDLQKQEMPFNSI